MKRRFAAKKWQSKSSAGYQAARHRRGAGRRRGVALLETAAVLIVLTPLFLGMVQYGRMSHATEIVTNLAREGARFGSQGAATTDRSIAQYIMDQAATTYIGNEGLVVNISPALPTDSSERVMGTPITVSVSYDLSKRLFMPARWMISRYENNQVDSACSNSSNSCWAMRVDPKNPSVKSMEKSSAPVRTVIATRGEANLPMYSAAAEMMILARARVTPPPPAATPTPSPKPPPTPAPTAGPTNPPAPTTPPQPTNPPAPTTPPQPTNTPGPTNTPAPTTPPQPTSTPRPTATPKPTPLPGS